MGRVIGRLHRAGIVHGDLTTSNMLWRDGRIVMIDFSLGGKDRGREARGVDLHLLREGLVSAHARATAYYREVVRGYREVMGPEADGVIATVKEIESRGATRDRVRHDERRQIPRGLRDPRRRGGENRPRRSELPGDPGGPPREGRAFRRDGPRRPDPRRLSDRRLGTVPGRVRRISRRVLLVRPQAPRESRPSEAPAGREDPCRDVRDRVPPSAGWIPRGLPRRVPREDRGRRARNRRLRIRSDLRPGGRGEDLRGDDGDGEEPRFPSGAGGGRPPRPPPRSEATLITLREFCRPAWPDRRSGSRAEPVSSGATW